MGQLNDPSAVDEGGLRRFAPTIRRVQQWRGFKRWVLGPPAALLAPWVRRPPSTRLKALVCRWIVVPGLVARGRTFEKVTDAGIRFGGTTTDLIELYIFLFGVWEPNLTAFVRTRLEPGDVFVDVGAHAGWFTVVAATAVGPTGGVVAIEASPANAARLADNVVRNDLTNVRVEVAAATSSRSTMAVSHGPAEHTGLTRVQSSGAGIRIRAETLPALVGEQDWARCRLVKIDVEGSEYEVVQGLRDAIDRLRPDAEIVVEVGPARARQDDDVARLFEVFTTAGYVPYALPNTYGVDSYLAAEAPSHAVRLSEPPDVETDVVFSRVVADRLVL